MDSTQLYQRILGLSAPWQVSEVNINEINGEVVVRVTHTGKGLTCPSCKIAGTLHDHATMRRWRHLDTCQMATVIECSIPRIRCENTAYSRFRYRGLVRNRASRCCLNLVALMPCKSVRVAVLRSCLGRVSIVLEGSLSLR
ncbi:MAG: transposase family protein [Fibrobacteres bacterium]|nr:transposase family protein [Fibrobacterota bacterium]